MATLMLCRAISVSTALYVGYKNIERYWLRINYYNYNCNPTPSQLQITQDNNNNVVWIGDIPDDVMVIILSKLDVISLCRCLAASPNRFKPLFSRITSLSFTAPLSVQLSDHYKLFYALHQRFMDYLLNKLEDMLFDDKPFPVPSRFTLHAKKATAMLFRRMMLSYNSKAKVSFMQRLSSLESIVIELPTPFFACDYINPNTNWFRWDSHLDNNEGYYLISVNATIIHLLDNILAPSVSNVMLEASRQALIGYRHYLFHFNSVQLNYSQHFKLKTIVSKDVSKNGRLTRSFGGKKEQVTSRFERRSKLYYLPDELELELESESEFNSCGSKLKIKDAWIMFHYYGDVYGDDDNIKIDEQLIMDCLQRAVDYPREELKQVVAKILVHPSTDEFLLSNV